jgi:hypothetical protein
MFLDFGFASSLLWIWPLTNRVGMGCYHLLMYVEFPHAPDPPKVHHLAVPIGTGINDFI